MTVSAQHPAPALVDLRQDAEGLVLGEVPLTAALPQPGGWLPPGASRPFARREESGVLELRQRGEYLQLSFWHQDGRLLWQESPGSREAAEALAEQVFGISPEQWSSPPAAKSESRTAASAGEPAAGARKFSVTVTRMTRGGNWAMAVGILLFSLLLLAGMYASTELGEYLQLGEGGKTSVLVTGILLSMVVALLAGFGLPFWVQIRYFGGDELQADSTLAIGPEGISLAVLGDLPWTALNAVDQVNTESGEPEAVILLSDAWGKLMFRATGSASHIALATEILAALFAYWRPGGEPAEQASPRIFRLLPIRRWWHEVLYWLGVLAGVMTFFALMNNTHRGFFVSLLAAAFLAALIWALVALMPQQFWGLTAANRARAFLLTGTLLSDNSGKIRVDLAQASVDYVHWRRPALAIDYLLIRVPGQPALRLTAFDTGWDDFVAAVRQRASLWRQEESPETRAAMRDFRG